MSVIFTTHSTHITSVAPINSIVHVRSNSEGVSQIYSTAKLILDSGDQADLERYLDARRGEIYFGAGVILVEGVSEEYLVPQFAELMGEDLDYFRVVVCNINSTNFKPYIKLLSQLQIPWCVITDGDFYKDDGVEKKYHVIKSADDPEKFRGQEIMTAILTDLNLATASEISASSLKEWGCFVGTYTLEVDMMDQGGEAGKEVLKKVFEELNPGGPVRFNNFKDALDAGDFWKALSKIESNEIGKGRFAQKLASQALNDQIPDYINSAIYYLLDKIDPENE